MAAPMETDEVFDTELLKRATAAAERWETRRDVREERSKALHDGRLLDADSPARLAMRVNHLIDDVRRASRDRRAPSNPLLRELVDRPLPVTAEELNNRLVEEVVINARDFLSVEFLERGLVAALSVGRVLIRTGGGLRARGTGFLVAPGLAITNEHVLTSAALGELCTLEMRYEQNRLGSAKPPEVFDFEPDRFFLNDRELDFALVAVAERGDRGGNIRDYGWLPMNGAQGKISITPDDYLNIIQHPMGREKEIVLRENRVLDLRTGNAGGDTIGPFIHYEGDTEKGSSGSPVLSDQWEVVALHHSGVPARNEQGGWLNKDGQLWNEGQPVADIRWIANEGIRTSSLVAAVMKAKVSAEHRALLDEFLSAQAPDVIGIRSAAQEDAQARDASRSRSTRRRNGGVGRLESSGKNATVILESSSGSARGYGANTVSFDVPLRIVVSIGEGPRAAVVTAQPPSPVDELLLERLDPEDYVDRRGYDRRFLGIDVPLPKIKANPRFGRLLKVPRPARAADVHELRYHTYSVLMNAARRLAYISACNVDFDPPATVTRDEGTGSWRLDPRIDSKHQLNNDYYADNDYDKGHLTRRDDASWGRDFESAKAANNDSFHYTNAAPQHSLFNRSDDFTNAGLDLWGDLENFISKQGGEQRTRLSLFNGPIFGADDRPLSDALVPLAYYKIVIWKDRNKDPGSVGFVLEQDDLLAEAIEPGRFEIRQRPIADIQDMLDLNLGPVVDWDRMGADTDEALADGGRLIADVRDIKL